MSSKTKTKAPVLSDSSEEDIKVTKKLVKDVKKVAKKQDSDSESEKPKGKVAAKAAPVKAAPKKKQDSDDDSDAPKKAAPAKKQVSKKKDDSDDESSEKPKKAAPKKAAKDSDSDSEVKKPTTRKASNSKAPVQEEEEDGHKELFIKNLPWTANEDSVREAFGELGTVVNVKLLTDKFTGKPKGIGFVEFEKRSDAKKALDGIDIEGRQVQCNWSNEKKEGGAPPKFGQRDGGERSFSRPQTSGGEGTTIFVGNLGFKTTDQQIKKFFSSCGNVLGVRIATHEDGKRKGFCHVDFDSSDACNAAVKLAGQDLDGREIRVDISQPRQGGGGAPRGRGGFGGGRGGFGGGRGGGRGGFGGPQRESYQMGSTGTKRKFDSDDE
jgi:nucleolin